MHVWRQFHTYFTTLMPFILCYIFFVVVCTLYSISFNWHYRIKCITEKRLIDAVISSSLKYCAITRIIQNRMYKMAKICVSFIDDFIFLMINRLLYTRFGITIKKNEKSFFFITIPLFCGCYRERNKTRSKTEKSLNSTLYFK